MSGVEAFCSVMQHPWTKNKPHRKLAGKLKAHLHPIRFATVCFCFETLNRNENIPNCKKYRSLHDELYAAKKKLCKLAEGKVTLPSANLHT